MTEDSQLIIVGDTHGQLGDVLWIFFKYGWPSKQNRYLFNGDIVDRRSARFVMEKDPGASNKTETTRFGHATKTSIICETHQQAQVFLMVSFKV